MVILANKKSSAVHILLLARYGMNGASSRVRHYSYIPGLKNRAVSVTPQWIIDDENLASYYGGRPRSWARIAKAYAHRLSLLMSAKRFDFIWIEKEALPFVPAWIERWALSRANVPAVFDFDDLWIRRNLGEVSGIARGLEMRKLRCIADSAAAVTVANGFLADALFKLTGREAIVLENCIDAVPYKRAAKAAETETRASGKCRIGWIGTPFTAQLYLPGVAGVLNTLSDEGLSETVLIGADGAVPELQGRRISWSIAQEADDVAGIDIGIQPLIGNEFDQCKSGWKIYQYMAAGKAVVASRVGFNAELIEDGVTGFLVDDIAGFERRLRQLLGDDQLRASMGAKAQVVIAERFRIERGVEERLRLFQDLAASGRSVETR